MQQALRAAKRRQVLSVPVLRHTCPRTMAREAPPQLSLGLAPIAALQPPHCQSGRAELTQTENL